MRLLIQNNTNHSLKIWSTTRNTGKLYGHITKYLSQTYQKVINLVRNARSTWLHSHIHIWTVACTWATCFRWQRPNSPLPGTKWTASTRFSPSASMSLVSLSAVLPRSSSKNLKNMGTHQTMKKLDRNSRRKKKKRRKRKKSKTSTLASSRAKRRRPFRRPAGNSPTRSCRTLASRTQKYRSSWTH